MLVRIELARIALFLRQQDRYEFGIEEASSIGPGPALLRSERKRILICAGNPEFGSHVLSRFPHRVGPIQTFHERVHKSPAQRRIEEFSVPAEGCIGLSHYIG